jgi:hypothetical protein
MKLFSRHFSVIACLLASQVAVRPLAAQLGPEVAALPALSRIGRSEQPPTANLISLYAAKGESESFQIVVKAPAGFLKFVNLTESDLIVPVGAVFL